MKAKLGIVLFSMFLVLAGVAYGQELRTEFFDAAPNYMRNKDKSFTGLSFELMKLVENDTGIKFVYPSEFVPLKRVVSDLQDGLADIQFGLAPITDAEKTIRQVETMYPVSFTVIGRKGDTLSLKTMEDFNQLKTGDPILVNYGTAIANMVKENKKLNVDDNGKDLEANINKLLNARGRVYIANNMVLSYFLKNSPDKDKFVVAGKDINPISHFITFSKKVDQKLIDKVESSVKKLKKNGSWQKVIDSYLKF